MPRTAIRVPSNSVIDWLRSTTNDWDARCRFPRQSGNQQAQTPPHTPPNELQQRKRKRKRQMSDVSMELGNDSESLYSVSTSMTGTTSGMSLAALKRPKLEPKSPTKRAASRSPSPTRKLLALLEGASPSIKCCQSGSNIEQPEAVTSLRKRLATGLSQGVIPQRLQGTIASSDPDSFDEIPSTAFGGTELDGDETSLPWLQIHSIYEEAKSCNNMHKDENAWVEVVRSVFRARELSVGTGFLELNSVQSQAIDPDYIPRLPESLQQIARKADLALAFSPAHEQVARVLSQTRVHRPNTPLSHMTDAYTSMVPLVCGIEVKEGGGNYNEAVMQFGVWSAAGLGKVARLGQMEGDENLLPFIGWTIVGHEWKLHIAWRGPGGAVTVLGPLNALAAGTSGYVELFTLFRLIDRIKDWLTEQYWPWLRDRVLSR